MFGCEHKDLRDVFLLLPLLLDYEGGIFCRFMKGKRRFEI